MLPTLYFEGDWVLINKLCRRGRGIRVGDVVSARNPLKPEEMVIKRVIGMPGDFVLADSVETSGRMIQVCFGITFHGNTISN
jgi:inner membrane protease subunit 1